LFPIWIYFDIFKREQIGGASEHGPEHREQRGGADVAAGREQRWRQRGWELGDHD